MLIASLAAFLFAPAAANAGSSNRTKKAAPSSVSRKTTRSVARKSPARAAKPPAGREGRTPPVRSLAAVVVDGHEGKLLFTKNERVQRPIASITKLMTALVYFESGADPDDRVTVGMEEIRGAGKTLFRKGEVVRVEDLLYAMLLKSDNVAARCVAVASGLTTDGFAARMNRKAAALGLSDTRLVEPTGLDPGNVSTALECAMLVEAAARNPAIRSVMATREYTFRTSRAVRTVSSTNRLLYRSNDECPVGKTGFILEAGYCIATCLDSPGKNIAVVVLGAPTSSSRFREANDLIRWALAATVR